MYYIYTDIFVLTQRKKIDFGAFLYSFTEVKNGFWNQTVWEEAPHSLTCWESELASHSQASSCSWLSSVNTLKIFHFCVSWTRCRRRTLFIVALDSFSSFSPWRAATLCLYSRQEGCNLRCNDDLALSWAETEQFVIFSFIVTPGNWLMWKWRGNEPFPIHVHVENSENLVFQLYLSHFLCDLWHLSSVH